MGKLQPGINDLYTWCLDNGEWGQQLLYEFGDGYNSQQFYDEETKSYKHPQDYSKSTKNKANWTCKKCGYNWRGCIADRTLKKSGCPICGIKRAADKNAAPKTDNSLYDWCQKNGAFGQQLLDELYDCDAKSIAYSSNRKVLWKCKNNHIWYVGPNQRTSYYYGCPYCNKTSTSYPEQFLYWALKQIYPQAESRYKALKSPQYPQGIEFDIAIPVKNETYDALCIEYSPTRWHSISMNRDQLKSNICKEKNIRFIYIMEDTDKQYEEKWEKDFICFHMIQKDRDACCTKLVKHILESLGHLISEVDLDIVKIKALEYSQGKLDFEQSLAYKYPELAKEWHKDNIIKPSEYKCGSHTKIMWHCTKCNYGENKEWQVPINTRVNDKTGCPKCGYNWYTGKYVKTYSDIVNEGVNDLASQFPELLKEIDITKNIGFDATKVKYGSRININWKCSNCGYEWNTPIRSRTLQRSGCKKCGYNCFDNTIHKKSIGTGIQGSSDLITTHPELAKEWHKKLNTIDIRKCSKGSSYRAYWQCINCNYGANGEWQAPPCRRTAKGYETGCPQCGYNWYKAQTGQSQKLKKGYTLKIQPKSEVANTNISE